MKKQLILILMTVMSMGGYAQRLSVNTDVMWDALMAPNLGLEMTTGNSTTAQLNGIYSKNPWGKTGELIGVQPEFRYYLTNRSMHGFFVGAGMLLGTYDFESKGKEYKGYGMGVGPTMGYVFKINQHINIDLHIGCGIFMHKQREYFLGSEYDGFAGDHKYRTNASGYYIMPTRMGVSFSYILF